MVFNFSAISERSFLGKFLRRLLTFIPRGVVLPILQGPLRGARWIVRSGVFGYWLGSYEITKQKLFASVIKPGDIVYDIGAHVGFYTLLASKIVGSEGKVFSFEPFSPNIAYLKRHIALNHANAVVVPKGVSNIHGKTRFATWKRSTSIGTIGVDAAADTEIEIETIALDDAITSHELPPPDVVKMDIEGGEYNALLGMRELLKIDPPIIFLATHSDELRDQCLALLRSYGYHVTPLGERSDEFLCVAQKEKIS